MEHQFREAMKKERKWLATFPYVYLQFNGVWDVSKPWDALNRRIAPTRDGEVAESDPYSAVMLQAYGDGDLVDDVDFKHRILVASLPGAGVFYRACEQRRLEVGCNKAHI